MRDVANVIALVVLSIVAVGCTAAEVLVATDASRIQTGTGPPVGAYEQVGVVTATHGGGCGLYGRRGNYEGADALLRNKATKLGADYVQILRVTEPRLEGICMNQAFVIDGLAYRIIRQGAGAPSGQPTPSVGASGLDGTYTGDIAGNARGQRFAMRVTFTIVQSGDQLAGTWNTTGGTSGTVIGVLERGRVTDFRARQVNPCAGEFVGALVVDGNGAVLRGQYAGSDCGGAVTASFEAVRQP
jgi:hypothetical protein